VPFTAEAPCTRPSKHLAGVPRPHATCPASRLFRPRTWRASSQPEFDAWRWHDYWAPIDEVIEFKKDVYTNALRELSRFLHNLETLEQFNRRHAALPEEHTPR